MPDLFKTREQLVAAAGAKLFASDSANELSAEDETTIDGYVGPLFARLAIDIVDLTEDLEADQIPVSYFTPLSTLLANDAKAEFGRVGDQGLLAEAGLATVSVRRIAASRPTFETQRAEYF